VTRALASALVLMALLACGHGHEYTGVGDVVAVDASALHVTIRHEDIPGYMGAMTMRFAAASPAVLEGVTSGAHVRFVLRDDGEPVVLRITVLPASG